MKWGDRYDHNYVNNLFSSIKTHTKNKTKLILEKFMIYIKIENIIIRLYYNKNLI